METTQENSMAFFVKSKRNQLSSAKATADSKWLSACQQAGRKRSWWEKDGGTLAAKEAELAAAEAAPSDPETGELRDCSALRAEVMRLKPVVAKRRYEYEAALAEVAALKKVKN